MTEEEKLTHVFYSWRSIHYVCVCLCVRLNRYGLEMENLLKVRFFGGRRGYTHRFTVESPGGVSKVYKCGAETAEVPAKVGDRVTMISASSASKSRAGLKAIPPAWKSGEPKALYVHRPTLSLSLSHCLSPFA